MEVFRVTSELLRLRSEGKEYGSVLYDYSSEDGVSRGCRDFLFGLFCVVAVSCIFKSYMIERTRWLRSLKCKFASRSNRKQQKSHSIP
jgi:hypothetical protein